MLVFKWSLYIGTEWYVEADGILGVSARYKLEEKVCRCVWWPKM